MIAITHCWFLTQRLLRQLLRQPWFIAFSLMQPLVWLLLYGQLFHRVVDLPGFQTTSYVAFLTPGLVMMSALFSSGWAGLGVIADLDKGIMDRFVISPTSRSAIVMSRLISLAVNISVQCVVLVGMALFMRADYPGGLMGFAVLLIAAILLGSAFGALSTALALLMRKQESVLGAVNFVLLPLTFLSPSFIASDLMPGWIQRVAVFNPVNWSVEAARAGLQGKTDWSVVAAHLACLTAFAIAGCWLAGRAFRTYQSRA